MSKCTGIWDHSIDQLDTVKITPQFIHKRCTKCGYVERLPRSDSNVRFLNNLVMQKKKWKSDDNRKELLQPMKNDGSINEDFTEAYGFNPYDERTKAYTPEIQGGMKKG